MRWLADLAYLFVALAYLPVALYNALIRKKNRRGWRERLGFVRRFDRSQPRIWIHAVSLGEINATPRLVEAIQSRKPDHEIVISTTTDTGYARAVQLYGRERVFRFPLDFSLVISRVLRRVNPSMIVLVELEVWYNLLRMADARGIPVAVVNGRLTERSAKRFASLGVLARSMFKRLAWVGAQDDAIAERFRVLGTPVGRVEVTSSLKWDSAVVSDDVDGSAELGRAMGIESSRSLWVCGSTGPGEESMILDAYGRLLSNVPESGRVSPTDEAKSRLRHPILAIIPRKPERFEEVARLVRRAGFDCVRRSERSDGGTGPTLTDRDVIVGDTMGELRKFYGLSDVVFVGRSLVPMGGSDPMEVAALGKPMIVGLYTDNFRAPVELLRAADALCEVNSTDELCSAVSDLLQRDASKELGDRARQVVLANQGATSRTADGVVRLLP